MIIYIYRIFLRDTMYELYLFMQAVRPIAHYVFFFSCGRKDPPRSGLMVSVNVTWWSRFALGIQTRGFDIGLS